VYAAYHDREWGVAPADFGEGEAELFERLSLEVFQVGLSWRLMLTRRENFGRAFAGFDPGRVALFDDDDVTRLAADPTIIRNRRKIQATIANARALVAMHAAGEALGPLIAAHRPARVITRRSSFADLPASTPESVALAGALKGRGFTFVGPTNMYALMQALGVVDDHLATCPIARTRPATDAQRVSDIWDTVSETTAPGA